MGKYKLVNGVLTDTTRSFRNDRPVTIITEPAELIALGNEYPQDIHIPVATAVAIESYAEVVKPIEKNTPEEVRDSLIDRLANLFGKYETPIGLLSKFYKLSEYNLNIIIDDSGSMSTPVDDVLLSNASSEYMASNYCKHFANRKMTRFEEAEDRVHLMFDYLAYIPTGLIKVFFMNRPDELIFDRNQYQSIEQFLTEAHNSIRRAFYNAPSGGTPTMRVMRKAMSTTIPVCHYLFTDGVPSDCSTQELGKYLETRANAHLNPITFVSCTSEDSECEWMKEIEESGPLMAEVDDYNSELKEVRHDQGPFMPYSKGIWIMCLLIGAINPYDLDAMDDSMPFTKYTFDNFIGRTLTDKEYQNYWSGHPKHNDYNYNAFSTEQKHAKQIDPNLVLNTHYNTTPSYTTAQPYTTSQYKPKKSFFKSLFKF
jgi:hypothetical protein